MHAKDFVFAGGPGQFLPATDIFHVWGILIAVVDESGLTEALNALFTENNPPFVLDIDPKAIVANRGSGFGQGIAFEIEVGPVVFEFSVKEFVETSILREIRQRVFALDLDTLVSDA